MTSVRSHTSWKLYILEPAMTDGIITKNVFLKKTQRQINRPHEIKVLLMNIGNAFCLNRFVFV